MNRSRRGLSFPIVVLLASFVVACASTPKPSDDNPSRVYRADLETTRTAALEAMAESGFDVTRQDGAYLEGFRPRRVGLAVGSGGETIGVWLEALDAASTRVRVRTAKSIVGIVGQKNWDEPVLESIGKRVDR